MNRVLKIILIVLLVIGFILFIAAIAGYRMVMSSLPVTKGELSVSGLYSEVSVYRDGFHIPHIIGRNEHDLFFTQGYVTAQDRLWQMDLWRRYAEGQLSEVFGSFTTKTDSMMLTIGIKRIAKHIEPELSSTSKRILKAYADGINAFIRQNKKRLPVEFKMLNYQPVPWEISDCLAVLRLVGWQLSVGWSIDPVTGTLVEKLGREKAKKLFPFHAGDQAVTRLTNGGKNFALIHEFTDLLNTAPLIKPNFSSNCWAVSGKHSTTGKPILASDPHLAFFNPSFWYEIHLAGAGFNASGFSIPGLPLVAVGYNDKIAWGATNLLADDLDFYIEEIDEGKAKYFYNGRYYPLETIDEKLLLRDQTPIHLTVRKTRHGPIVSDILEHPVLYKALSLRWIGQEPSDECLAFYKLNLASDWNSFREALQHFEVPPQNFLYADADGNIGYQAVGKIPLRNAKAYFIPQSGSAPENDWKGFIPFEELPSIHNPKEGIVASANDNEKSKNWRWEISSYFDLPYRVHRIEALLSEKPELSVMDMKKIQGDLFSGYALDVLKLVLPRLGGFESSDPVLKEAYGLISRWDGQMKPGSAEALVFEEFLIQLLENVYKDELSEPLYDSWLDLYTLPMGSLLRELGAPRSPWWDNVTTPEKQETMEEILRMSFKNAVEKITKEQGSDISNWSWGKVHTLVFEHPLGQISLLNRIFNIGPFHMGGSGFTLNRMGFSPKKPFQIVWGTSGRMIVDLSEPDNSISVLPTGQSGQPMDGHYNDQTQLFIQNLYHPNLTDTTKIVQAGWECLKMKP